MDSIEFNQMYSFTGKEVGYIVDLLEHVYSIRTIDGGEDELLGDFIEALDNAETIQITDDELIIDEL